MPVCEFLVSHLLTSSCHRKRRKKARDFKGNLPFGFLVDGSCEHSCPEMNLESPFTRDIRP